MLLVEKWVLRRTILNSSFERAKQIQFYNEHFCLSRLRVMFLNIAPP